MNTVQSILKETEETSKQSIVVRTEYHDIGKEAVKIRFYLEEDIFVQVYRNDEFDTTNFALILNRIRIYGRDEIEGKWHRHPAENPSRHNHSEEGQREISLLEFWQEVETILKTLELI